eukprot:gene5825-15418_t
MTEYGYGHFCGWRVVDPVPPPARGVLAELARRVGGRGAVGAVVGIGLLALSPAAWMLADPVTPPAPAGAKFGGCAAAGCRSVYG